jgi:2-keto-4-pentenoate hydratase
MNDVILKQAAAIVANARLERRRLPNLDAEIRPRDEAEGYRLQAAANEILSAAGYGPIAGHKIGCTTQVIQSRLGIDHPLAGGVFANSVKSRSARLPHADYVRPGVECEIAVRLGRDLPPAGAPYSIETLREAIDACMVSMEIIDDRYDDLVRVHVPSLIADNVLDAGVVLGEPVFDWRGLDLAALRGTASVNGKCVGEGHGRDVLGHPLHALQWLVNHFAQRGIGLKAGEFVSTGSIPDLYWVARGDRVSVSVEQLGTVGAIFV